MKRLTGRTSGHRGIPSRRDFEPAQGALRHLAGNPSDLIAAFIQSLDLKERSRETYRKALRSFADFLERNAFGAPAREHVLAYRADLLARGLSALSVSTYLTAVRRFFAYLEAEKLYPNIAAGIKGMKKARRFAKETLTAAQVRRLVDAIPRNDLVGLRDFALVNLMLRTGLRTVEVARADLGDIGTEGGALVLRVWGKGRDAKDAFVLLTDDAYNPLLDYTQARGAARPTDPLFVSHSDRSAGQRLALRSIRRIIQGRLQAAGLKTERVTAHSLRHTTATLALLGGADLVAVKDMLRHTDLNTTLVYVHTLNRVEKGAEKHVKF